MLTCKQMESLMDEYMEHTLADAEKAACEQHLETCKSCQQVLEDLVMIQSLVKEEPLKALPEGFSETLHEKLVAVQAEGSIKKPSLKQSKVIQLLNSKRMWQMTSFAAVACLAIVVGTTQLENLSLRDVNNSEVASYNTGEGNTESTAKPKITFDASVASDSAAKFGTMPGATESVPQVAPVTPGPAPIDGSTVLDANRQMIFNGNINLEVKNQQETVGQIKSLVQSLKGFVENSSFGQMPLYTRDTITGYQNTGNMVLRVPATQFEKAYEGLKALGRVTGESQYSTDVTQMINDTSAQIKNLEAREQSLRTLMKQAKTISEIMEVDRELASVRGQIDSLKMTLKQHTSAVAMSTITVNLVEVKQLGSLNDTIDGNLFNRAWSGLLANINWMFYWLQEGLVIFIAWMPAWVVILVGTVLVYKRKHTK